LVSVVALVAIAVPLVVGWSDGQAKPAAKAASKASGPLIVNFSNPPATLDPATVNGTIDIGFVQDLYVTLVQYGDTRIPGAPTGVSALREDQDKIVPYLAKSYTVTNGGKTLTFKLRPGVKFPSGRPVDSYAVKATYERLVKIGASGGYYATGGGQPADLFVAMETPDPLTYVIRLKRPEPLVLQSLAQPPMGITDIALINEHGKDAPGKANPWLVTHAAGSGPYLLKEYRPGIRAVLEANPDFFGPKPFDKNVIINFIPNDATLLLQARNNKADVTVGLSKRVTKSLEGAACCRVVRLKTHSAQLIALPNKIAPFNNKAFREALTYAVPYPEILKTVGLGYGELFYGPIAPAMPGFNPKLEKPRRYDLAKAKALLKTSGVKLPVTADLVYLESQLDMAQIAAIVQDAWAKIGVNVKPKSLPDSVYNSDQGVFGDNKTPIMRLDGASVNSPLWLLDYDMTCGSFANTADYCNPKADKLLRKAHVTVNSKERQKYFDQIINMWTVDSPRIPVYAEDYTVVLGPKMKQWRYTQNGPMDIAKWRR
jgi:peptide/nickel transport system substrate-binding protein